MKDYKTRTRDGKISFTDIKAFIRSAWTIGILSNARVRYWRLILKTLFTQIKAFPVSVELAIQRLHYEKIAKQVIGNKK